MLTQERQMIIRDRLTRDGKVIAADLATEFAVSEDTVRRDLRDLTGQGVCDRVYGGAILRAPDAPPISRRQAEERPDKRAVAELAATLVQDGQVLFIDAGSTNLLIAQALPQTIALTVVTNAPLVATALATHPRVQVILLGGILDQNRGAATGGATLRAITEIHADIYFAGTCGLDAEAGLTAFDAAEAEVKRAMAAQSSRLCVVATPDKLGTRAPFRVVPAAAVTDLVTTRAASAEVLARFDSMGLRIAVAKAGG